MSKDVKTGADGAQTGSGDTANANPGDSKADAGTQASSTTDNQGDGKLDISKLDPAVQKLISDLRKENGDHRVKNKSLAESHGKLKQALVDAGIIEDDSGTAEEKLAAVTNGLQGATLRNAILENALEYGVGKDAIKYFEFLVQDRLASLEEDGELTENDLAELAQEARGRSGASGSGTTSVGDSKGTKPNPQGSGEVTLDQFTAMNITDRTLLFKKNPDVYNRLFAEAKSKKLLMR